MRRKHEPWIDPRLRDPDRPSKGADLTKALKDATRGSEEIARLRQQLEGAVSRITELEEAIRAHRKFVTTGGYPPTLPIRRPRR